MTNLIKSDKVKNAADKRESDETLMIWFQNVQNLEQHVIINGSTSLHVSAIIKSQDVADNNCNTPLYQLYITLIEATLHFQICRRLEN